MLRARVLSASVLVLLGLVAGVAQARVDAKAPQTISPPTGLRGFLLRADETEMRTFPRTPSFAWNPVPGAWRYEFQLSTSLAFGEGTVVWESSDSTKPLRVPVVAVNVALPWITGNPYSLYARVRAVKLVPFEREEGSTSTSTAPAAGAGTTPSAGAGSAAPGAAAAQPRILGQEIFGAWSTPFGFNMRWTSVPQTMTPGYRAPTAADPSISYNPQAGLLRWTPVEGATAYDVWLIGAKWRFTTTTNVADARDVYALSGRARSANPTVRWRVRAIRRLYGEIPNAMPATSYGPWSEIFEERWDPFPGGALRLVEAVSGSVVSTAGAPQVHDFTPAFRFTPDAEWIARGYLYRVYIASDADCVNIVFRGAAVPGPVYAPRATGPLKLPQRHTELMRAMDAGGVLDHGTEGVTKMVDGTPLTTSESVAEGQTRGTWGARVDLWDTAWPNGGYYWTVVPVVWSRKTAESDELEWYDLELPQDACQSGRVQRFGKTSAAVVASGNAPYASGLSSQGRLTSAAAQAPAFYGTPLVSWQPALGADSYEIEWSKTGYPWKKEGGAETGSTAFMLPVTAGTWWYRVRGLNNSLPKKPQMTWSLPVRVDVARPKFKVVGGENGLVLEASGLTRYGSPVGFSVAVPPSWELNVNSATGFQAQAKDGTGLTMLFDDRKPPTSTDAWKKALGGEAAASPGYVKGSLASGTTKLPSGTAIKLTFKRKQGKATLAVERWVVFPGDREYTLTYATPVAQLGKQKRLFTESAKSFRLN